MGVPSLLITTAENQNGIPETLQELGAAIHAGWHKHISPETLTAVVGKLILDKHLRQQMVERSKIVTDGLGAKRVAGIVSILESGEISAEDYIRPAGEEDCLDLWRLANDPNVRKNAFSSRAIPLEDHKRWYRKKLTSPDTCIFVLDIFGVVAGQIRYDKRGEDNAEIDFAISPRLRNKSLGKKIIQCTREKASEILNVRTIRGIALDTNIPSQKCFLGAGFVESGKVKSNGRNCISYEAVCKN